MEDFERRVLVLRETFTELQMVVAPELHLTAVGGFFDEHPDAASETAQEIPGALTERLGSFARATGLWLVPGSVYELGEGDDFTTPLLLFHARERLRPLIGSASGGSRTSSRFRERGSSYSMFPTSGGSAWRYVMTAHSLRFFASSHGWAPRWSSSPR
jgi:hypothetical protein